MHDEENHAHHQHGPAAAAPTTSEKVTDPVCGMKVDPATSKHSFDYDHRTFHFCCAGCRQKFIAAPAVYLDKPAKPAAPMPKG